MQFGVNPLKTKFLCIFSCVGLAVSVLNADRKLITWGQLVQILHWSFNHLLRNIMPNLRIDLLVITKASLDKLEQ